MFSDDDDFLPIANDMERKPIRNVNFRDVTKYFMVKYPPKSISKHLSRRCENAVFDFLLRIYLERVPRADEIIGAVKRRKFRYFFGHLAVCHFFFYYYFFRCITTK